MGATYTVVKGDTLSEIAQRFRVQYNLGNTIWEATQKLAKINNISNPDRIAVGQVIKLQDTVQVYKFMTNKTSSSNSNQAKILTFGIQSNTDRTLFASWKWTKSNTQNYKVKWLYDTFDGVWFVGNEGTEEATQSVYTAPSNAYRVKFMVKPISKTREVNGKETSYWTASWSTEKVFDFRTSSLPAIPPTPTVEIKGYKLTATLDNLDVNTDTIQFKVIQDDAKQVQLGTAKIQNAHASYSCTVSAGHRYKVACRSVKEKKYSDWSQYSSNINTPPSIPDGISCKAKTETSVIISWRKVENADTYSIEYATKKEYFDGSDQTASIDNIETLQYEKTGLESGEEYFFRVKAVNDSGSSGWSQIYSIIIGKKPSAPTTWSSTTTAIIGEPLKLYWVHNTEDNSSETKAEIELYINGIKEVQTVQKSTDEDKKDLTSEYLIDTSLYPEGAVINWRVRTAGITGEYGDWSIQRTIDLYAPPSLTVYTTDLEQNEIDTVTSFPFDICLLLGPISQAPISFSVSITAMSSYETVDSVGNFKMVKAGEEIFSYTMDVILPNAVDGNLTTFSINPYNVTLENNITYKATGTVTMNTGLTASNVTTFLVSWKEDRYEPNAEIGFDPNTLSTIIRPYCIAYPTRYFVVTYDADTKKYIKTTEEVNDDVEGIAVDGAYTTTFETVYMYLKADGSTAYFCVVTNSSGEMIENVTLSVYRREFDGTFTTIATGLKNTENTYVTDPHPSLDYARYRIIASSNDTGTITYYDVPGYPIGEKSIIIQWNEEWTNFNTTSSDKPESPEWSGSLLKLPYNIDVSNKYSPDVEGINYIGRRHPVSYYGTHIGETATWNVDIAADDVDTLYALRRLAIWMGDVYVREPSGSGYWANVNVSFKQTHRTVTIPVTIEIIRVEGGM